MFMCSCCLEEVNLAELYGQRTPCCEFWAIPITPFVDDQMLEWQSQSVELRAKILGHISSMPADSKKRRKTYNKPEGKAAWPGKWTSDTATFHSLRKKGKNKPQGGQTTTRSFDIISSTQNNDGWTVHISGTYNCTIASNSRAEARRKARQWLRSQGTSITLASTIEEGKNITNIHYDD